MSATPLVDKRAAAFYNSDGNVSKGKYTTYNQVVADVGGFAVFTTFCALKDAVLQFLFTYIIFSNFINNTFDTTVTSGAALYILIVAAGDEQYINITEALAEWLANVHAMYKPNKDSESQWSLKNNFVTGFSTFIRVICMIGGCALGLNLVVKEYGAAAVTAATQLYTVKDASTIAVPTTWGLTNIFLYVMFYNLMFVGLVVMYKHKINKTNFSLKNRAYSAFSVAGARTNYPIAISFLYMVILRSSSPNIGDPIQIQVYAVFQWYLQTTNGVGAVIGGAYVGAAVVLAVYALCYNMSKSRAEEEGYTKVPS
jgi:hypothetical protein